MRDAYKTVVLPEVEDGVGALGVTLHASLGWRRKRRRKKKKRRSTVRMAMMTNEDGKC